MPKDDTVITLSAELDVEATVKQINKDIEEVQKKLNKLILSAKLDKNTEKNIKSLTQSLTQLQRVTEQLSQNKITVNPEADKINTVLQRLDDLTSKVDEIRAKPLDIDTTPTTNGLETVDKDLKNVKTTADNTGKSLKEMLSNIGINVSTYQAFRMIKQAIQEISDAVDDYNKYHTNLRIITGESNNVVDEMLSGYTEESIKLGIDIDEYENAAEAILRTGKNAAETNMILKDSAVLSKTGFINSEKAANNLITIANAYNLEADAIENVVDKILSLDVASQTEGGALSTAVARTAKNAQLAGVTIDSLAAQIANLRDITGKEEEQIATSLNSIYSRMYNVKLGKFIIEDESGVEDITEDISDMEKILRRVDVQLRDSKGTFRDFDDIIRDLHNNWNSFNEVEKNAIGKTLGGTYHKNVVLGLIQEYEDFQKLQDISLNSAGTAAERYEAYTESIAAKSAQLETALKQMWAHTIDSDLVTDVKGATTEIVQFIDKYEILQNLLKSTVIYGAAKGFVYLGGTISDAYSRFKALSQAFNNLTALSNSVAGTTGYQTALSALITNSEKLSDKQVKLLFSTKQLTEAQMMEILQVRGLSKEEAAAQLATMGLIGAEGAATTATFTLSGAFKALSAAIAANPIGAEATALMALFSVFSIIKRKSEEAAEAERELQAQVEQNIQKYNSEGAALDDLIAKYTELSSSSEDTAKVRDNLSKMQSEMVSSYGSEAEAIDLVNGKYSEEIEKLYELKRARADVFVNTEENIQAYNNALNKLNNAGNINGDIDVNVKFKGGISQEIRDQWKEMGLIADSLQYSMSSKDYGFKIEGGENAETLYLTLEKMADSYKELATAAGDFNEEQYTAIKQQAIAAKETYDNSKAVVDLFEKNKAIAEFKLTPEAQTQFDDLLDSANELNKVLNSDVSATEKYAAATKLSDIKTQLHDIANGNEDLVQMIDTCFSAIETGAAAAYTSVGDLRNAWFESLDEMQKGSLKTVESMQNALQTIANGDYLDSSTFWELAEFDTTAILNGAHLVGEQFAVTAEQLIELKDNYINGQLSALETQQAANIEALKGLDKEKRELLEQLKIQKAIVEAKLSGQPISTPEFLAAQTEISRINALIKKNEEGQEKYNEQVRNTTLLTELWKAKLGDTTDMTEALTQRQKKLNDEISRLNKEVDGRLKAQEYVIDGIISGHEKELSALEAEKNTLQKELDILNEQKDALDDIIKNYDSVNGVVQKAIDKEISSLEDEKKSIEDTYQARIDALKAESKEREDALEYAEKLKNLENAKNNKVRVYDEARGWHYAAKADDISKAQTELYKYENSKAIEQLEAERDALLEATEDLIESKQAYADQWKKVAEKIQEGMDEELAAEILGADWREKIANGDIETLEKFEKEYSEHNTSLQKLTKSEIALKKESIKAKDAEIDAKKAQIQTWKDYKKEVQDTMNEIKLKQEGYIEYLDTVTIDENSTLEERTTNLNRFRDNVTGMIDTISQKQGLLEGVTDALGRISGGSYEINFDVWGLDNLRDAEEIINSIRYGIGVIMSEEEALYLWANGKLTAADMVNKYKNGDVKAHLSQGGVVNYTGLAMLHGSPQKSETVFNATDSAKLYDLVHNTPNLLSEALTQITSPKAFNRENVSPINSETVNINIEKVVADNPEAFAKQLDRYYRTKLTESYTQR